MQSNDATVHCRSVAVVANSAVTIVQLLANGSLLRVNMLVGTEKTANSKDQSRDNNPTVTKAQSAHPANPQA